MHWFYSNELKARMRHLLGDAKGLDLLDVPCGSGDLRGFVGECNYVGVDIDHPRVAHCSSRLPGLFAVGDATSLPFPAESFDRILVTGFFHHVDDAAAALAIRELARVLRPAGSVVVLDAIWPRRWYNIPGFVARAMDEGRFVRWAPAYDEIFGSAFEVSHREYPSVHTLECVLALLEKPRHTF
jgi:ubiquinone/menaquinone biosynthesis C-methylase UbiE